MLEIASLWLKSNNLGKRIDLLVGSSIDSASKNQIQENIPNSRLMTDLKVIISSEILDNTFPKYFDRKIPSSIR